MEQANSGSTDERQATSYDLKNFNVLFYQL